MENIVITILPHKVRFYFSIQEMNMSRKVLMSVLVGTLLLTFSAEGTRGQEKSAAGQTLPEVLIIGDSISIGYTPFVAELLKSEAKIIHNKGNAAHTGTGLQQLDAWLGSTKWDVIHFNWGLHDLCYRNPDQKKNAGRDKVNGKLTTSLEQYEKNLDQLVERLEKTGAKLIWAHTTVVPEGEDGRIAGDHKKYNEVATKIMKKHNIPMNDLQSLSESFKPELFTAPGNVHFKPDGYKKLAEQVAASIRTALKPAKPSN